MHATDRDRTPLGSGFLVDAGRVLTCAHVVLDRDELWVALPKADRPGRHRIRVRRVAMPPREEVDVFDVALLVLEHEVPDVPSARLRQPPLEGLVGSPWWSFGFPDGMMGNPVFGAIGAELGYGWVRLDVESPYPVASGYSGAAVWSSTYDAVIGMVVQAQRSTGNARALTIREINSCLPGEGLDALTGWTVEASGETALAAWGWSLSTDPEATRHWQPRGRGVSTASEQGFRFRGRTTALNRVISWMTATPAPREVLVVTGSPGVGKSAVLGRIVTTASPAAAELPAEDRAPRAPRGSVSCAVHVKGKTALDVAREIARAASAPVPDQAEDLTAHLRTTLEDRAPDSFVVVIDALDEATTPEEARLLVTGVILPLAENCADLNVRVVVGSRRQDDLGHLLRLFEDGAHVVDLDDEEFFVQEDLVAYALASLQLRGAERPDNPYNDDDVALPVARRIAVLAEGNFLVAGLVARTHGLYDRRAVDPGALTSPARVDAVLHDHLARLPDLVPGVSAATALTALAYAEAPGLPLGLWRVALAALSGVSPSEEELRVFAHASSANFLVDSGTPDDAGASGSFRLFHQALNDALLHTRAELGATTSDEQRLAAAFIAHGRESGWDAAPAYLLRSLPRHASRGGLIDTLLAEDDYPLYADLRRLIPQAATAVTARARARLLRATPQAIDATPATRTALFSVTEAQQRLGDSYRASSLPTSYRAVWSAVAPQAEHVPVESPTDRVRTLCAVTVDDRVFLASAGDARTVRLWDPATGEHFCSMEGHTDRIRALCAVAADDRELLASAGEDRSVRLWDPATGEHVRTLEGHTDRIRALCAVHVDGRELLASGGEDSAVRLWDPATGEHVRTLEGHTDRIRALCAVAADGRELLASGADDGSVRLWNPATGDQERVLEGPAEHIGVLCAVESGGTALLAACGAGGSRVVRLWNPATGELAGTLDEGHADWVRAMRAVAVDGRTLLAIAGDSRTVRLWDPATGEHVRTLEGHTDRIRALCTVPVAGREVLASGSDDDSVRLWELTTGEQVRSLGGQTDRVRTLCAVDMGDHTLLASAGFDGIVRLWDPVTGAEVRTLEGHTDRVRALCAVTVDGGTLLASAGDDGTVRLWNLRTMRPAMEVPIRASVNALAWADGLLVVGFQDRMLALRLSDAIRRNVGS
ncbi:trypsin-like peptidase domain-containing protein [Streptomyces sp. NBC_01808]|uniref:trypsin-like peptidase domain-containing protein n=1 Tax=Streptomyces sp. NBC_01808 TaxID=2975947 RepID=UPI002DD9CDA4|nr:trypsin-like peptidase domain-containing protein [Streptomyces sp. NBC_01808]WSA37674.1 trypsin-like peptidase domain-containing protein [Streptomyces sp. NBC_01808]